MVKIHAVNSISPVTYKQTDTSANGFQNGERCGKICSSVPYAKPCQEVSENCSCYLCSENPLIVLNWLDDDSCEAVASGNMTMSSVPQKIVSRQMEASPEPSYFIYSQYSHSGQEQFGILAAIDVNDCRPSCSTSHPPHSRSGLAMVRAHENITCSARTEGGAIGFDSDDDDEEEEDDEEEDGGKIKMMQPSPSSPSQSPSAATRKQLSAPAWPQHMDPVLLMYRERADINRIVERIVRNSQPLYTKQVAPPVAVAATDGHLSGRVCAEDNHGHDRQNEKSAENVCKLWRVSSSQDISSLQSAFSAISSLYIADGHHRVAAACAKMSEIEATRAAAVMAGTEDGGCPCEEGDDEEERKSDRYITAILFPHTQLSLLPYHRCVRSLNGLSEAEFLTEVSKHFSVTSLPPALTPPPSADSHSHSVGPSAAAFPPDPPLLLDESPQSVTFTQDAQIQSDLVCRIKQRYSGSYDGEVCVQVQNSGDCEEKCVTDGTDDSVSPSPTSTTSTGLFVSEMYLGGQWYELRVLPQSQSVEEEEEEELTKTGAEILTSRLFVPVLGECEAVAGTGHHSDCVMYVDGTHSKADLTRLVDSGQAVAAFALRSVTVEQIMAVGDRGKLMPPKATFFSPKPITGVMRRLYH